ncbi:MAG: GumC family protein [Planctomycetaceae bacterium]
MTSAHETNSNSNDQRDLTSGVAESFAPETTLIHQLFRFIRLASLRKGVIILCCTICAGLGGAYYVTAKRLYESRGELLILDHGSSVMDESNANVNMMNNMMPTFLEVMKGDAVILDALKNLPKDKRTDFRGMKAAQAVKVFQKNLSVTSVRHTNVLELTYVSSDRKAAAAVLNSLLNSYIHFMDKTHHSKSEDGLAILTQERVKVEHQLEEKQAEYDELMKTTAHIIGSGESQVNPLAERVDQLNDMLVLAQKETLDARGNLDSIEMALLKGEDVMQFVLTNVEVVGRDFLMNELGLNPQDAYAMARMNESMLNDRAELQEARGKYGPNHPKVRRLVESIRINQQFIEERPMRQKLMLEQIKKDQLGPKLLQLAQQRYKKAIENEHNVRLQFESEQQAALSMNADFSRIQALEFHIKRLQENLTIYNERMREIEVANKSNGVETAIIAKPQVPERPISPRLSSVIAIVVASGFGLGLLVVYILDVLDDRFRTADELRYVLRIPILAMIRKMAGGAEKGIHAVQTFAMPNSIEGEAFRMLRTTIEFMDAETSRVAITSSEPGDGKTTVLANLAVAYAQSGKRTLLIDADMRRPGLSTLLDLRGAQGLSRILHDERPIHEAAIENLIETAANGLHVIPSGPRPPNPAELLASTRFADLLEWADSRYDQVLIDAPPVLAVTDPAIIGRVVDGMVLVVRPDKNHRRTVVRAVETLTGLNCHLFGLVANHLNPQSEKGYGYGYGYEYGYGHDEADREGHGPLPEDEHAISYSMQHHSSNDSDDDRQEYHRAA